jgi:hypothetical protein
MFRWISEVAKRIAGVVADGADRSRRRRPGGNGTSALRLGRLGILAAFWIMVSGGVATAATLPPVVTVSFGSTTAVADLSTPLAMNFTITNPNPSITLYGITVAGSGYPDSGWWPRYAATGSCFTNYHASISGELTIILSDPLGPGQSCTIVDKFYIPRAGGPYSYTTGPITSGAPTATTGSPVTADNTVIVLIPASGVSITSGGTAQSAMVGTGFSAPLAIKAVDVNNHAYTGFDVVFTAPASGASAKFSNGASSITVQTDSNGIASVPVTAGTTPGSYTVTATISGVTKTFSLSNIGDAVGFTLTPSSTSVTAGTAKVVTVRAIDSIGNIVTGYTGTVHFTSTDPAATLPADTTLTSGMKSVNVTLKTVGSWTITATDTSTAATGTSSEITVSAGTPASLTAGPGTTPQSAATSTAFPTDLSVGVTDAYGNAVSGASVSFAAPSSGASGKFAASGTRSTTVTTNASGVATASALTANAIGGSYTVTASIPGLSPVAFALTNIPPTPTVTSVSPALGNEAGGNTVNIYGTNLTGATAVRFGAVAAASYSVVSDTKISATSPAGTGTVDVTVTTLGGTSAVSAADRFTYASTVSTLSALSLSQGTLSPSFASGTTAYTASVANGVSSLTVTPTATQADATIKVNGTTVTSGSASGAIALAVGSNTISVVVTAQDGTTKSTYTVTVTRAASADATLSALSLSSGTLSPRFASGTTAYTASVANGVSSLTVTPTATQADATIKVNGTAVTSGSASGAIPLAVGSNTISIVVAAQDGTTKSTYTVTVTRAASADATLSALSLSQGTLSPSFASGTTAYTASVANGVSSLTVTPTATQADATIKVNGTAVTSGSASGAIPLAVGANTISVVVTAQDGTTKSTYTVTVTRAASADATLSALSLSSGTLSPGFASGTTAYTASVANGVSSLTVTPTATQADATIKVNGTAVTSGAASGAIALAVGSTTISVVVTAQDGTTKSTYTVTVTRAASADATLSALSLSQGTLSPSFASGTTAYTASVANGVSSLTVTPTATQADATIKVNGSAVTSGSASGAIALAVGANTIAVVVTAQDGTTKSTYTVTVTRAGSSTSSLSALTLSSGTLSPSFASGTTAYTASVANGVASLKVTPTATQADATIKVNGTAVASGSASGTIALAVGSNTISIVVTAQDGVTSTTYTVTVTRAGSSTSSLSALSLSSGTLSPSFASGTTAYTASVANGVASLKVTPTATQADATIKVNGTAVASGSASGTIALAVGSNTISVVVTAQDGTTKSTYTVTVTRAASADATLSALSLSSGTLSPGFASGTTAYTASVANGVSSLTVTPTATQADATIKVDGTTVASGSASGAIALAVGSTTISVVVTAQDGVTTTTYTVTVTRAAAGPVVTGLSPSSGAASGGTSVAITGSGFAGATAVTFGTTPAAAFTVVSSTSIVATSPAGTGTATVTVTTPAGTSSAGAAGRFTWVSGPVIGPIAAQSMTLGTPASFDMKITGGYGTFSCSAIAAGGAVTNAGIAFDSCGAGSNRVVVTPAATGSAVLTLSVSDAAGQKTSIDVSVTVRSSLAARTVIADKTLRVGTAAARFVPVVGEGGVGALGYSIAPSLPAGLVFAGATGAISGTPTAAAAATTYTVTVTDATSARARASFSLVVLAAITAEDDTAETKEGLAVTIRPTANDVGGPFTGVVLARGPSHGTATVSGLDVTYVPRVGFTGTDSFTYRAMKGSERSQEATVRIAVAARPRPDRDPGVSGLISAQNQAARLLGETQLQNFQQRLESLHGEGPAPDSFGINLSGPPGDDRTVLGYDRTDPEIDRNRGIDPDGRGLAAIERRLGDGSGEGRADRRPRTPSRDDGRFDRAFSFWTSGALTIGNVANRRGTTGNAFSTSGVTAGVDHRFDQRLTVGVGVGYGRIANDIGNDGSNTVAEQYAAAVYASFRPTRTMFVDGIAGVGHFDFTSARGLAGSAAMATGRRGGREFFGSLAAGEEYRGTFDGHRWLVSPFARLDVIGGRLDGFTETSPVLGTALRYGAQSFGDVSVDLGLRGKIDIKTDFGSIAPFFRAEFQHDLQTSRTATVSWADLIGGATYDIPVTGFDQNRLMLGAGLDLDWYGYLVGLQYQTTLAASSQTQTVGLKFRKRF